MTLVFVPFIPMRSFITPDLVWRQPINTLTVDQLKSYGLRALILDVDNTLVSDDEEDVSPLAQDWINAMRQHFQIALASNNFSHKRIQRIATTLDLPYRSRARKPSRRAVNELLMELNLPVAEVAMIGDRLFTDTIVGKRLGLFAILVEPWPSPYEMPNSIFAMRSSLLRQWEIWLARRTGVKV
jgi:HAD superfamily phosphatase (TIGR01668 family)